MKKTCFLLSFLFAIVLILPSCKPTEKGYKSAYDAALGKRQAAMADIDVEIPQGKIQQVDGPQLREVDGKNVYVINKRISPAQAGEKLPGSYNVAVGSYKMITNASAQSQALADEGFEAFPAKDAEGTYYTIAASLHSLSEAVAFCESYKSNKNRVYVGLPDSPVIIYSPR